MIRIQRTLGLLVLLFGLVALPLGGVQAQLTDKAFKQYPSIVDYKAFKELAVIPVRKDVAIIDARPARKKYNKGHIPGAISIPNTFFNKMVGKLPKDKKTKLVFYCGGYKCPLSHKSAFKAEKLGYTDIAVFAAGYPEWKSHGNFISVAAPWVKKAMEKQKITLIDARPTKKKYNKGHVPGAINIPNTFFDKMANRLPADKKSPLVFYCGGFKCPLSVKSASKAKALGYTDVKLFQAGYPAWKMAFGPGAKVDGGTKGSAAKPMIANLVVGPEGGTITFASFKEIIAKAPESVFLVDVRDDGEYGKTHFPTAVNIPVEELEGKLGTLPTNKPIIFICATGARSGEAYDIVKLLREDITQVYYLDAEIEYADGGTYTLKTVQ